MSVAGMGGGGRQEGESLRQLKPIRYARMKEQDERIATQMREMVTDAGAADAAEDDFRVRKCRRSCRGGSKGSGGLAKR